MAVFIWFLARHLGFLLGGQFVIMMRWLTLWLPFQALSGVPFNALMGLGVVQYVAVRHLVALSMILYIALISRSRSFPAE